MKVKNAKIENALRLINEDEEILLVADRSEIKIVTNALDSNKVYTGEVTWIGEDAIGINGDETIFFEYIDEIEI